MKSRTVRELGGEISAEIYTEQDLLLASNNDSLKNLDYLTLNKVIDLMMSVLARHTENSDCERSRLSCRAIAETGGVCSVADED
jgi:hypothetical protein